MTLVVDANIAMHWTISSQYTADAERLLRADRPLIAPDLIIPEFTNALLYSVFERSDRTVRAMDGLEFLPQWFSELVPTAPLRYRAMAIAMELRHAAYDCFYLALALDRQTKLVTTDEKLIDKACGSALLASCIVHLSDWKP